MQHTMFLLRRQIRKEIQLIFRGNNAHPRPCLMEAGSTCQQQPPKPTSQEPLGAVLGGVESLLVFSLLVSWVVTSRGAHLRLLQPCRVCDGTGEGQVFVVTLSLSRILWALCPEIAAPHPHPATI